MNPIDLIARKRDGEPLSDAELDFLIRAYVADALPDYQMAAWLMAIYFQGLSFDETAHMTRLMRDSGDVLDLSGISTAKVDKHSTGGVGDKVSLVLAPLVAAAGLVVPMISGRALGHTGGTLDKLEAIPGFSADLNLDKITRQLQDIGVALVGQTDRLCPADKKIYALRDATATVNSIPLITSSILSKKLAEDLDALVVDVKAGSGAIFPDPEKAWELGRSLVKTAQHFDLRITACVTDMQQPLGFAIGNWLETQEAVETLRGEGPPDLLDVTLTLGSQMLVLAGAAESDDVARRKLQKILESGAAFERFVEVVERQGGDTAVIDDPTKYSPAKHLQEIRASKSGYVTAIDARSIGTVSMELGAGRLSKEGSIDYAAGIVLQKKVGDQVAEGEVLAVAHTNDSRRLQDGCDRIAGAYRIEEEAPESRPVVLGFVDEGGEERRL